MNLVLFETIAFVISILSFIYGLSKLTKKDTPMYFNLIVNAVGCYALEELWVIVDAICGFQNGFISVRLIGIFGCFCTFLTASANENGKINNKVAKSKKYLSLIAPITAIIAFIIYVSDNYSFNLNSHIVISFIILIPLIIDSYFELQNILTSNNHRKLSIFILLEYIITLSYLFIRSTNTECIIDILSAIIMALIIYECKKEVNKWKTSI